MSDRKYYCFCDSNCKFETMTKEQIMAAIAQAAQSGLVFDEDAAFITKVKEANAGNLLSFWVGTQAQYNALQTIDSKCYYIITDKKENTLKVAAPTITLAAGSWYNKQQTVNVSGVDANCLVIATPAAAADNESAYAASRVRCVVIGNGELTFECDEVPDVAITVNVAIFSGNNAAAILNAGGGGGGFALELLWENATPSADFAATTSPIAIPGAADYDYFMMTFADSTPAAIRQKGSIFYPMKLTATNSNGAIWVNMYYRGLTMNDDGLTASNCIHLQYNGTKFNTLETTLKHMRPLKIFGMKGVPV